MSLFKDIEELSEWLEPLSYEQFWEEITPYNLVSLEPRDGLDQQIAAGETTQETVLVVQKAFARIELTSILGLQHRDTQPFYSLH